MSVEENVPPFQEDDRVKFIKTNVLSDFGSEAGNLGEEVCYSRGKPDRSERCLRKAKYCFLLYHRLVLPEVRLAGYSVTLVLECVISAVNTLLFWVDEQGDCK